jgi:hypothetical protein
MKILKSKKDNKESLKDYFNNKIYFGPFTGLKVPDDLYKILSVSEILGMYESCLHPLFSQLFNRKIKNIVLVGGNNGYYSAGLSFLYNPEKLIIYEMFDKFHPIISSWFEKNNLKNYEILGEATITEFKNWKQKTDLIFIDCEGFEVHLLDPTEFEWQKRTDVIVELHPFFIDNLLNIIAERFNETHEIEILYDDFNEDDKIEKILNGLNLNIDYNKHPNHRWIIEENKKVFTSGIFMFLKRKSI